MFSYETAVWLMKHFDVVINWAGNVWKIGEIDRGNFWFKGHLINLLEQASLSALLDREATREIENNINVALYMLKLKAALAEHAEMEYDGWAESKWQDMMARDPDEEPCKGPTENLLAPGNHCHPSYGAKCREYLELLITCDQGPWIECSEYLEDEFDYGPGPINDDDCPF